MSKIENALNALRTRPRAAAIAVAALAAVIAPAAQAGGHYVPGVEGVQAASVPPPGTYYLGYLVNYQTDSVRAPGGSTDLPGDNSIKVTALANRLAWITGQKVLGADYGVEAIVPLQKTSLDFGGVGGPVDSRSGVGDIYLGPLVLGWHGANWDAAAAAGLWLDNGSTSQPASPGKGYKSTMLTGGATYYFDAAKSTTGSLLMRYEINGKTAAGFKPGSSVSLEWGVGQGVGPVALGVVGYNQWQVGTDSGTGATSDKASRAAIGGEVTYPVPGVALILKGALYKEYSAKAGTAPEPKGTLLRATLIKPF
jgi:hypothetical protein